MAVRNESSPKNIMRFQAGLLDAAHESLRVGVQIGGSRWQLDGLHSSIGNHAQELRGEQRVTVVNQIPFFHQNSIF